MVMVHHQMQLRIRYSETDQMGTFYNSRVLEWFECARTELLRAAGRSYAQMEQSGVLLPLVEAAVRFQGRARYDDLLDLATTAQMNGKASVRFDISIAHATDGKPVATGHTIHAITDAVAKPIRPPSWFIVFLSGTDNPPTGVSA